MFQSFTKFLPKRETVTGIFGDRRGAAAIEYALIAAGIAVVILTAISPIGAKLSALFASISGGL